LGLASGYSAEESAIKGNISDSYAEFMKGYYRLVKFGVRYHRPIGVPPPEEGPNVKNINETIDQSVFERWGADEKYRPPGLVQWAARHSVDPAKIQSSVFADAPGSIVPG
jgi:hypothetical protein